MNTCMPNQQSTMMRLRGSLYLIIALLQVVCSSDVLQFTRVSSRVTSSGVESRVRWRSHERLHATWLVKQRVDSVLGERHWMVDTDDVPGYRSRSMGSHDATDAYQGTAVLSRDIDLTTTELYLQLHTNERNFVMTAPLTTDETTGEDDESMVPKELWGDIRVLDTFPPITHFHDGDQINLVFSVSSRKPLDVASSHVHCESKHPHEDMTFYRGLVYGGYMDGQSSSRNMTVGISIETLINQTHDDVTYTVRVSVERARGSMAGEYACALHVNGSDTVVLTGTWFLPNGQASIYPAGISRLECKASTNILLGSEDLVMMPNNEPNMVYCYLFARRLPSSVRLYHDGALVLTSSPVVTSLHVFDSVRFSHFFSRINRKHSGNYTWFFEGAEFGSAAQILNVLVAR